MSKNVVIPILLLLLIGGGVYVLNKSKGANSGEDNLASPKSVGGIVYGTKVFSGNCTYTIGYWKNHPEAWPILILAAGNQESSYVSGPYNWQTWMSTLSNSGTGDAWYILAKQLFAAELNIANGADSYTINQLIANGNSLLNSNPSKVSPTSTAGTQMISIASTLDSYNNGITGPGHCGTTTSTTTSGTGGTGGTVIPS